jgi:hypothetical protein
MRAQDIIQKKSKKIFCVLIFLYLCLELIINLYNKIKMKKVFLSLAAVAVLTVVSCKKADAAAEGDEVAVDYAATVVDSAAAPAVDSAATVVDSAAAPAATTEAAPAK